MPKSMEAMEPFCGDYIGVRHSHKGFPLGMVFPSLVVWASLLPVRYRGEELPVVHFALVGNFVPG